MAEHRLNLKQLERLFSEQADRVGECPLPDPQTTGDRAIEHVDQMSVKNQPLEYNYDEDGNATENSEFRTRLKQLLKDKEITPDQYRELSEKFSEN